MNVANSYDIIKHGALSEAYSNLDMAKKIVNMSIDDFLSDFRNVLSLRHLIVQLAEILCDICLHIAIEGFKQKPETYTECIYVLKQKHVISEDTAKVTKNLIHLGNRIIHRYWIIDDSRLYNETKNIGLRAYKNVLKEVEEYVKKQNTMD